MPEIRLKLKPLHPPQKEVVNSAARFNIVDCGRRWGKTTLGEDRAVHPLLEGGPVGWFSPDYKTMIEVWRDFVQTLTPVARRTAAGEHRIELLTGGVLEFWTLENPNAGRSRKYARVIVDEAAAVANLEAIWQQAIRPTLTDLKGDAWFLSTPKGHNFFWQCYNRGQDRNETAWQSWKMPTSTNPFLDPQEIEEARRELPERTFSQEYLADFLEDGGGVFRFIREAATAIPQENAMRGHDYIVGADWGRQNDFTVFAVIDLTLNALVYLDRSNRIEYALQLGRLQALCERFKPLAIIAEENSMGTPVVEQLRRLDLPVRPFTTTNATKQVIIDALALAFERQAIQILDEPNLISELLAYDMERLPSGLIRYGAPPGAHDDTVMALALAWHGARFDYQESPITSFSLPNFG